MNNPNNGKVVDSVLPPLTGPELAALRMDSMEQRIANLERMSMPPGVDDHEPRRWLVVGLLIGLLLGWGATTVGVFVAGWHA